MYNNLRIGHVLSNGTAKDLAITLSAPFLLFYHVINLLTLILEKKTNITLNKKKLGSSVVLGKSEYLSAIIIPGPLWRRVATSERSSSHVKVFPLFYTDINSAICFWYIPA